MLLVEETVGLSEEMGVLVEETAVLFKEMVVLVEDMVVLVGSSWSISICPRNTNRNLSSAINVPRIVRSTVSGCTDGNGLATHAKALGPASTTGKKRSMMGIKMGYGEVVAASPLHRAGRRFVRIGRSVKGQILSKLTNRCSFRTGCEE